MSDEVSTEEPSEDPPASAPSMPAASAQAPISVVDPEALDDDSSAQVQRVFIILMIVAGVVCLLPRQYVSAGMLFGVALIMAGIRLWSRYRRSTPRPDPPGDE